MKLHKINNLVEEKIITILNRPTVDYTGERLIVNFTLNRCIGDIAVNHEMLADDAGLVPSSSYHVFSSSIA